MLVRGGISGTQRIARHLGACALGCLLPLGRSSWARGTKYSPTGCSKQTCLLSQPLPLVLLIFWLFRISFTSSYKKA